MRDDLSFESRRAELDVSATIAGTQRKLVASFDKFTSRYSISGLSAGTLSLQFVYSEGESIQRFTTDPITVAKGEEREIDITLPFSRFQREPSAP